MRDGARRQPLPLHRLPADHRRRARGRGRDARADAGPPEDCAMSDARVVGQDVPRVDGLEKVTGAAPLHRRPEVPAPAPRRRRPLAAPPRAGPRRADGEGAARCPGVRAVASGRDFPLHTGIYLKDQTVFATDRVRFVGDPVAAVAAETPGGRRRGRGARRGRLRAAPADLRRGGGHRRRAPRSSTPTSGSYEVVPVDHARRPAPTSATT